MNQFTGKNETRIKVQLHLCFDNDFDVYSITNELKIHSADCKNRSETKINPITKEYNCGYWTIETQYLETLDLEIVLDLVIDKIKDSISKIKTILKREDGFAKFDIICIVEDGEVPSLYLGRKFLEVAENLKAVIDIDLYMN